MMHTKELVVCDRIFDVMEEYHGNWYVLIWNLEVEYFEGNSILLIMRK